MQYKQRLLNALYKKVRHEGKSPSALVQQIIDVIVKRTMVYTISDRKQRRNIGSATTFSTTRCIDEIYTGHARLQRKPVSPIV